VKILCVGGGPGGLWSAIAAKVYDPAHEVTVLERRPPDNTYGWGIVYWHRMLQEVRAVDPATARRLAEGSVHWPGQRVVVQDQGPIHLGGTGFGMSRRHLIDILRQRASTLGVRIEFEHDVCDLSATSGADLVVLSDGANSRLRQSRVDRFGTVKHLGRNKHIWLGSRAPFSDFTFAFEATAAGWLWFHAYRYCADASTVIVECSEQTWSALGFDSMGDGECRRELSRIFARHLHGATLECRPDATGSTQWSTFATVSNARWYDENVVLLGDSAHATHFSIGSGTRMAFEDGSALGRAVASCLPSGLAAALQGYQDSRLPEVTALQREAQHSVAWFEDVDRNIAQPSLHFGYALRTRRTGAFTDDPKNRRASLGFRLHQATQWRAGRAARRVLSTGKRAALRLDDRFQGSVAVGQ
jgi:anthraniloyl-CoA monooxygenase